MASPPFHVVVVSPLGLVFKRDGDVIHDRPKAEPETTLEILDMEKNRIAAWVRSGTWLPILLALLLAAPALAQSAPTVSQTRTQRTVLSKTTTVGDTTVLVYVMQDSFRTRVVSRLKPADSAAVALLQKALADTAAALQVARDSLAKWPSSAPAPSPAPTPTPVPVDTTPAPPPVTGALYPNRPANYTKVLTSWDMGTATYPTTSSPSCELVPDLNPEGWRLVLCPGNTMRRVSDATAPQSPPYVMEQVYPQGASSGGNVAGFPFFNKPGIGATELYASVRVWYSTGFPWNDISQKFLYFAGGNLLLTAKHNNDFLNVYIGALDQYLNANKCTVSKVDFEGKWAQVEWQVRRGASGLIRVWLNGKLCLDYATNVPGVGEEFNLNSTWGGSTGPIPVTGTRRIDHVFLATP